MIKPINIAMVKHNIANLKKFCTNDQQYFYLTCMEDSAATIFNAIKGDTKIPVIPLMDEMSEIEYKSTCCSLNQECMELYRTYQSFEKAGVSSQSMVIYSGNLHLSSYYLMVLSFMEQKEVSVEATTAKKLKK